MRNKMDIPYWISFSICLLGLSSLVQVVWQHGKTEVQRRRWRKRYQRSTRDVQQRRRVCGLRQNLWLFWTGKLQLLISWMPYGSSHIGPLTAYPKHTVLCSEPITTELKTPLSWETGGTWKWNPPLLFTCAFTSCLVVPKSLTWFQRQVSANDVQTRSLA